MKIIFEFDNIEEARDMLDLKEQFEKIIELDDLNATTDRLL